MAVKKNEGSFYVLEPLAVHAGNPQRAPESPHQRSLTIACLSTHFSQPTSLLQGQDHHTQGHRIWTMTPALLATREAMI